MVSAGSVLSTGALTFQWDINEQSPGRMLYMHCTRFHLVCILYSSTSFLDNKLRKYEIIKTHDKYPGLIGLLDISIQHNVGNESHVHVIISRKN